jgi:undecaprenyl pyrophosphate synthase
MSNFLLLQCAETPIAVVDVLWPELTLYHVAKVLIKCQLRRWLPGGI